MTDDGCLQCPWHAALYDVASGGIVPGAQGAFKPVGCINSISGCGFVFVEKSAE